MTSTPALVRSEGRLADVDVARIMPWFVGAMILAIGSMLVDSLPVGVVRDDGMYVILAKSLATGHGYRWLNVPGMPPATHFPPGYPAVLAVLWWLYPAFPANVLLFKIANALFAGVAGAGTARLVHQRVGMSPTGSSAFALVALLGIPTLSLSAIVFSEPLFLAILLPALLLAERVVDAERAGPAERAERARLRDIVLIGVMAGAATLVRTHGIALIAALPIVLVVRRRSWRVAAIFTAVALAVVLPWQLWAAMHAGAVPVPMRGNYESYGPWLVAGIRADGIALLARTAVRTSTELLAMFATLAAPSMPGVVRLAALLALGVLAATGARPLWRQAPATAVFLVLYVGIVVLWPFTPARFVWGIWPLVLMPIVLGARRLIAWRPRSRAMTSLRVAALVGAGAVALGYGTYTLRGYRGQWWESIPRSQATALRPLVAWAAQHTQMNDLLAVEEEGAVYLYAGRQTVPVHTFTAGQYLQKRSPRENAEVIRTMLASYPITHVVVSSTSMREAARELALATPPVLAVRDTFAGGIVLVPTTAR